MTAFLRRELSGWRGGEVAWLVFCQAAILSLSLYWGDGALGIIAAVTGMMYTLLAGKGKLSCYFFGVINAPLYAFLSWRQGYYGDMALNIYYFAMMFPGFVSWKSNYGGEDGEGVVKTRLSNGARVVLFASTVAGAFALWPVLEFFGGSRALCDAFTNVLSVAAMLLAVRRCIEQWVLWIAVDAIEVAMWWNVRAEGVGVSVLLMWLLFLVNGVYLLRLWMRKDRAA